MGSRVDRTQVAASRSPRADRGRGASPRAFRAWLVVANPATYDWDAAFEDQSVEWDRAFGRAAQRAIREGMKPGDRVFGYRTRPHCDLYCELVVGSPSHQTPNGTYAVEFRPVRKLRRSVPLAVLKSDPALADIPFVRQPQLSICGLTSREVARIRQIASARTRPLSPPHASDLAEALLSAQSDTSDPGRFERLIAEALSALGMEARRIGGAGRADVVGQVRMGSSSFSVVVDAKTSASGPVRLGQVDFQSVEEHRQAASAGFAALVGSRFSSGKLVARAVERGVALVRTEWLVSLLRIHAEWPLSVDDLRTVYACRGHVDRAVARLEEAHRRQQQLAALVTTVLELFDHHQLQERTSEPLTVREIRAFLRERAAQVEAQPPPTRDVESLIEFLANPLLRVLLRHEEGYVLSLSPPVARRRIAVLGHILSAAAGGKAR